MPTTSARSLTATPARMSNAPQPTPMRAGPPNEVLDHWWWKKCEYKTDPTKSTMPPPVSTLPTSLRVTEPTLTPHCGQKCGRGLLSGMWHLRHFIGPRFTLFLRSVVRRSVGWPLARRMVSKPHKAPRSTGGKFGSQSRTRTCNLAINSRLLCQLSYLGMNPRAPHLSIDDTPALLLKEPVLQALCLGARAHRLATLL